MTCEQVDMFGHVSTPFADDAKVAADILTTSRCGLVHIFAVIPRSVQVPHRIRPTSMQHADYCWSLSPVQDGRPGEHPILAITRNPAGAPHKTIVLTQTDEFTGEAKHSLVDDEEFGSVTGPWEIVTTGGAVFDLAGKFLRMI